MMLFFFILYIMLFKGHNSFIFCDILAAISMLFHNGYFQRIFILCSKNLFFKIEEYDVENSDFYAFL